MAHPAQFNIFWTNWKQIFLFSYCWKEVMVFATTSTKPILWVGAINCWGLSREEGEADEDNLEDISSNCTTNWTDTYAETEIRSFFRLYANQLVLPAVRPFSSHNRPVILVCPAISACCRNSFERLEQLRFLTWDGKRTDSVSYEVSKG